MSETGMGAVRSGGSSSEPGEEDYVTVVYNDEVKNSFNSFFNYGSIQTSYGIYFPFSYASLYY